MIEEKIIVGENTKYPLNGLLTLPDNITSVISYPFPSYAKRISSAKQIS